MIIDKLNTMLVTNSNDYVRLKGIVEDPTTAPTVAAAVEASGVYQVVDPLQPAQVVEARAVFQALAGQTADQQVLTALRNAFAAGRSISVAWLPSEGTTMTVGVNTTGHPVTITLHCPPGNTFL